MSYEVVDPEVPAVRRVVYASLTDAMVAAGPSLEVWELADDTEQTRLVRCWPDPEFEAADEVTARRIVRQVHDLVSRADREASTVIADTGLPSNPAVHAVVSLAWSKGYVAGFGDYDTKLDAALERIYGGERK